MLFSVVIPCRDDQAGLDEALASVLAQPVELEAIVVDDGSVPPLSLPPDPRVRVVRRDTASGPAAARNAGLAVAQGEFVAFCDSDDLFTPDRLRVAAALHERADVAVVGQSTLGAEQKETDVPASLDAVADGFTPHLGATSVRRTVCGRLDERYLACEDVEWWIRVMARQPSYASSRTVGYLFRPSERIRVLNSPSARLDFSYALLQHHQAFYRAHRRARAFRWVRIAALERREGSYGLAAVALAESLRARPTRHVLSEALRLGRALVGPRPRAAPVGSAVLPPLTSLRARRMRPRRAERTLAARLLEEGMAAAGLGDCDWFGPLARSRIGPTGRFERSPAGADLVWISGRVGAESERALRETHDLYEVTAGPAVLAATDTLRPGRTVIGVAKGCRGDQIRRRMEFLITG